jgi:hypothetical protein
VNQVSQLGQAGWEPTGKRVVLEVKATEEG